jgi:uncharacterized membrane protein
MTHIKDIIKRPSAVGIIVGLVFMALSLTPSLIPRPWIPQAAISALSFLCGYGIGVGLNALWRYLQLPTIPRQHQRVWELLLLAISGIMLLYYMYRSLAWQNNVRETVSMPPVDSAHSIRVVLLGAVLAILLLLFFRLLWWLAQTVVRVVNRFIPRRVGQVIGILLAIWLIVILVNGVLVQAIFDALNSSYALTDSTNYDNVMQPTSPLRSGSPESLAAWETLGREGRRFAGTGPSAEEIAVFWGDAPTAEPIRIYIGEQSAETLAERADLALQELLRTNAFERQALVLVTSTGNGWVDANAIDSLEYMYGGDTAIVAFQYSYLPSVYSLIADQDAATDASLAMFNEIHQYWQTLDEETRPVFYLYGLSLGAYGSQAAVSSVSLFNDPINGALWAGPPFVSEFWRQITRDRDPGSPIWRPVYQGGTTIRFTNQGEGLQDAPDAWQENRFIYLQQAGDPIVFFPPDSLYREPEWLSEESRSPKAPSTMRWYPVVTFWQLIFDMVLATSDTLPDGNGHRYGSDSYIDSWVALTQPENWSEQRTEELKELFNNMGNPNQP